MRRLTAWNIYQSIEYSGEQNQLKLYDFFLALIRNMSLISTDNRPASMQKFESEHASSNDPSSADKTALIEANKNNAAAGKTALIEANKAAAKSSSIRTIHKIFQTNTSDEFKDARKKSRHEIVVESSYKGVEIKTPVTKQMFHDLINAYKEDKPLHVKYVILILEETLKLLRTFKNINMISTSTTQNITIVGDLHGSLDDLLLIFYKVFFRFEDVLIFDYEK
jgi:serine/threonine-protein phosphatase with EF-hand domain